MLLKKHFFLIFFPGFYFVFLISGFIQILRAIIINFVTFYCQNGYLFLKIISDILLKYKMSLIL